MEKEEKVVVVLLAMALASLAVAYITFHPCDDARCVQQLTESSVIGDDVVIEGTLLDKSFTFKGDHLLLSVEYNTGVIKVFIPNNAGALDVDSAVNENDRVRIVGVVDEYNGEREVVVHSKNDVTVL